MSALESISMAIGAVLLILWAIIIAAFAWAWLSWQRAERKRLKVAARALVDWQAGHTQHRATSVYYHAKGERVLLTVNAMNADDAIERLFSEAAVLANKNKRAA